MVTESMASGKVQVDRVSRGMTAERVFTVAQKEFTDQLTGWRFLVIFALFLSLTLMGTYSGVVSYERGLDRYSEQLAAMDDRVGEPVQMMPSKPPVADIYSSMFLTLISCGGLLAIAVGFDLVSEREGVPVAQKHSLSPGLPGRDHQRQGARGHCPARPHRRGGSPYPPRSSSSSRSCPPR